MSRPRKAIAPRPGGHIPERELGKHRVLVYCDDSRDEWGWWCRDCPDARQPQGSKAYMERLAYKHAERVQVVSGASRATLRGNAA